MLFGAHYPDSGIDALLKMRPTQKELDSMGPGFTERWETFYKKDLDKPVAGIAVLAGYERRSHTPSPYNCPCLEECCLTCLPERSSVLAFTLCVPLAFVIYPLTWFHSSIPPPWGAYTSHLERTPMYLQTLIPDVCQSKPFLRLLQGVFYTAF